MKILNNGFNKTTPFDGINYTAITQLERLNILEPTQTQIDLMEQIIRISTQNLPSSLFQGLMKKAFNLSFAVNSKL